jgi:hypothetical protein
VVLAGLINYFSGRRCVEGAASQRRQDFRVRQVLRPHRKRPHHFVQQLQAVLHFECQLPEKTLQLRGPVLGVRGWRGAG